MQSKNLSRRDFLRAATMAAVGVAAASCAQPTPQVIEKPVTVVVEREVPVEKQVLSTVIVEKEVPVEKVVQQTVLVEKEKVVKETVVVEREKQVEKVITATPVVMKYREAPMLAGLVAAGKLPPVDERLPDEPMVITPHEEIGQYGGTWHRLGTSVGDTQMHAKMVYEWMIRYDMNGAEIGPNIAKSWEISPDGREYIFSLRKGMKWSDGAPYTADDILFHYEDIWLNEDLANVPAEYKSGGEPVVITKIDDTTIRCSFEFPHGLFIRTMAGIRGGQLEKSPKHYLSQFHEKYADKAVLDKMVKDEGREFWYQVFQAKDNPRDHVPLPVIHAWQLAVEVTKQPLVFSRNPYYWKVDSDGNQLPYIDRIEWMLVQGGDQINIRAIQGEVDMQLRHITFDNYPLFQENKEKGDYRLLLWNSGKVAFVMGINQTNKDPVLREIAQDKRFRYALSLGMNRPEIIEAAYLGITEPSQVSPLKSSPHFWEPQAKEKIEYDPDAANDYLDDMGLTERDAEGYRLRPDGERLTLVYEYANIFGAWGLIGELLTAHWKDLGIELIVKEGARQLLGEREASNELDVPIWDGSGEFDPLIEPRSFMPHSAQGNWGHEYANWWRSGGTEGEEPTGDVLKLFELWEEIKLTVDDAKQRALFRQMLELNKENLWMLGVSTPPPTLVVVKNNFRNVPEVALYDDQVRAPGNTATEQYFIKQ